MNRRIFADFNATTPCSKHHLEALCSELFACDGNPSSIHHFGREARVGLERARKAIAQLIGARSYQIYFTSGATEANNIMLQGFARRANFVDKKTPTIAISTVEHPSVDQTVKDMSERNECKLHYLDVDHLGVIRRQDVEPILSLNPTSPLLVSCIHVNNEVGSINPIQELATLVKSRRPDACFHMDAVQSLGKLDLTWVGKSSVDALSFSAHKVGALKGIGCLYLKDPEKIHPLMFGGQQEQGLRPGTENLPGAISFGLVAQEIGKNPDYLKQSCDIRKVCKTKLCAIPGVVVHGPIEDEHLSNTFNFHMEGVTGQELMIQLDIAGISVSSGSACSSGTPKPSRILVAMGYSEHIARNSIRVSFGIGSQYEDIDAIVSVISKLRQKYPHT